MEYSREKMGALLVRIGLITEEQLDVALAKQAESGGKLGEVLARDLVVTEDQIAEALAEQKGLLHVNLACRRDRPGSGRAPSVADGTAARGHPDRLRRAAGSCSPCRTRSTSRR